MSSLSSGGVTPESQGVKPNRYMARKKMLIGRSRLTRERATHQADHRRGRVEHVAGCEAEETVARVDQSVLAAVVGGEAVAMRGAVVLDDEALARIAQVWPGDEDACVVVERNLHTGFGQAGEHKEQPQSGLHWALGSRLRKFHRSP